MAIGALNCPGPLPCEPRAPSHSPCAPNHWIRHPPCSSTQKPRPPSVATACGFRNSPGPVPRRPSTDTSPEGVIRCVYVTDLNVGRSPDEVLRVLDALQTDELCPCNWKKGEDTIKLAA